LLTWDVTITTDYTLLLEKTAETFDYEFVAQFKLVLKQKIMIEHM